MASSILKKIDKYLKDVQAVLDEKDSNKQNKLINKIINNG